MKNRLIIQNGKVIFPDKIMEHLTVVVENGKIAGIVNKNEFILAGNDVVIDADNRYVAPGFTISMNLMVVANTTLWTAW